MFYNPVNLDDLLKNNNFMIHTDLIFWLPKVIGTIFEVYFWFPNENVPYNRLYIRTGALLKDCAQSARIEMNTIVFPKFEIWLKGILQLPNNSTHLSGTPYFNAEYINGTVEIITSHH
jgi:hypothetical protein